MWPMSDIGVVFFALIAFIKTGEGTAIFKGECKKTKKK